MTPGFSTYLELPPPPSKELGHKKTNHKADHTREVFCMSFRHLYKLLIPATIETVRFHKNRIYKCFNFHNSTHHLWYSKPFNFKMIW